MKSASPIFPPSAGPSPRYTYVVTNYPDPARPCQLNLYVCDGVVAAGDLVCTGENGFVAGLAFPAP